MDFDNTERSDESQNLSHYFEFTAI